MAGAEKGKAEKADHRGDGGEENGAEAGAAAGDDRVPADAGVGGVAVLAVDVDEVDEDDGVIHHDAGEGDGSHDRHQAHGLAGEEQTEDHADDAEGNDGHDDNRLEERVGDGGKEGVNEENGHEGGELHRGEAALSVFAFSGQLDAGAGMGREQFGDHRGEDLVDLVRGCLARIDVGRDGDDAFLVGPFDAGDTADPLDRGEAGDIDRALRAFDQEVADKVGVLAEPLIHLDANDDLVVAPAQAGSFEAAEGAEEGASDLGGVESGARSAVFVEAETVLGFATREVISGID